MLASLVLLLWVCGADSEAEVSLQEAPNEEAGTYIGDPRHCLSTNKGVQLLQVLPGYGWDNLRNRESGSVVAFNYSLCKTTLDGKFVIPDNVETVPRKSSRVNTFAEIISRLSEYSSLTSRSININAGLSLPHVAVSGSFTDSYQHAKSKQIGSKSIVTRVQLRYVRYTARLLSDTQLSKEFKDRLLGISSYLEKGQRDMARYESEVLVRDFGTHYLYSTDAGAILVQEDQITKEQKSSSESEKSELKIGASASFFNIFHFSMSYSTSASKEQRQSYERKRTSSQISTFGGPKFQASNFTANDWTQGVDDNMVAIDRIGAPLHLLVTPSRVPDLSESQVQQVSSLVNEAIQLYYKYNSYPGCTQSNYSNYNPTANVDDGTCVQQITKTSFGGAYQTCRLHPLSNEGDFCKRFNMNQKNPKTGDYSCPKGFQAAKLRSAILATRKPNSNCFRCPPFYQCCPGTRWYKYQYSEAYYSTYWCAGTKSTPKDSGYLFGGVFTSKVANPLTEGMNCPLHFYPIKIGVDLRVCISDDVEFGEKYSVPFGGFISCEMGNPLAISSTANSSGKSLKGYYGSSNVWPKQCPSGYSRHLAVIDQDCEINYCAKFGSIKDPGPLKVKLPPFMKMPTYASLIKYQVMDPKTRTWVDIEKMDETSDSTTTSGSGVATGEAVGIAVGCLVLGIMLTVASIVLMNVRRRAAKRRSGALLYREQEYRTIE